MKPIMLLVFLLLMATTAKSVPVNEFAAVDDAAPAANWVDEEAGKGPAEVMEAEEELMEVMEASIVAAEVAEVPNPNPNPNPNHNHNPNPNPSPSPIALALALALTQP
jgi:hypothetical protein